MNVNGIITVSILDDKIKNSKMFDIKVRGISNKKDGTQVIDYYIKSKEGVKLKVLYSNYNKSIIRVTCGDKIYILKRTLHDKSKDLNKDGKRIVELDIHKIKLINNIFIKNIYNFIYSK